MHTSQILVRFSDCDPAGIVFYPRYLEMFSNLIEDWCREQKLPYCEFNTPRGWAMPTVHLEVDFPAPSMMGETLTATLGPAELGASSITLDILLRGPDGSDRVRGRVVLVLMDLRRKRPVKIPPTLRQRIAGE